MAFITYLVTKANYRRATDVKKLDLGFFTKRKLLSWNLKGHFGLTLRIDHDNSACLILNFSMLGYDGVPVDAMQALDINESPYGQHQGYHNGGSDINYDSEVPHPPQDNNQVAAWYDTDL